MSTEIGGYFQLEMNKKKEYHRKAIALNSGRNALEYILRATYFKKIYLPFYTCDVLLEPIKKTYLSYEFYEINEKLEPIINNIYSNEVILITNYFGILDDAVKKLANKYPNVIIDNCQAFYSKPIKGVDTFYSCRKFFGVPDGSYLFTNRKLKKKITLDISHQRMSHLLIREDMNAKKGYAQFLKNEKLIRNQPIKKMSLITSSLMKTINYNKAKEKRRDNFLFLHQYFEQTNELNIITNKDSVPMIYPYLTKKGQKFKEKLIANKIYVATYWPNVFKWIGKNSWEYYLASNLVPLPIDQRYSKETMNIIISKIID